MSLYGGMSSWGCGWGHRGQLVSGVGAQPRIRLVGLLGGWHPNAGCSTGGYVLPILHRSVSSRSLSCRVPAERGRVFVAAELPVQHESEDPTSQDRFTVEVEKLYMDAGDQPRITTLWGLWFLLPLIGNIIWYVRIQNAINEFWQARGGTTSPGLA